MIDRSLDHLHPAFRQQAQRLAFAVAKEDLPMRPHEGRRTLARQAELVTAGVTTQVALASPHVWGLAIDWCLAMHHPYWDDVEEWPTSPWDTGIDLHGRPARPAIIRSQVLGVWRLFGQLAQVACGLDPRPPAAQAWGGAWYAEGTTEATHWIGIDPGHVQHPTWQQQAKQLPKPSRPG